MSTDRELLELAAKAAGLKHYFSGLGSTIVGEHGVPKMWTPLTDDGDALRLAVKLEIYFMVATEGGFVSARIRNGIRTGWHEDIRDDANSAARRAIVRAAAAIGESMP